MKIDFKTVQWATMALLFGLVVLTTTAHADSTQQYSKIYLNPFYRASMSQNTNYSYLVEVNPPDKVYQVQSAIVTLDVWLTPTVTFTIWANDIPCNTPSYTVSTTFASAGQGKLTFDCTNAITKAGIYNITIRPTQANTGASTAWLDITYTNNPVSEVKVLGTEYVPTQNGTVFLQLVTGNVTQTICDLTIFAPNKTVFANTVMVPMNQSTSLYYYDFTVPSQEGVYMSEALCRTPLTNRTVLTYYGDVTGDNALRNSSGSLNTDSFGTVGATESCISDFWEDTPAEFGGSIKYIQAMYNHWVFITTAGAARNFQLRAEIQRENFLTNINSTIVSLAVNGTATTTPTAFRLPDYNTTITLSDYERIRIRMCLTNYGGGAGFSLLHGGTSPSNMTRILNGINTTQEIEYRGSGEIHVTDMPLRIWTYENRNLTWNNLSETKYALSQINATTTATNTTANSILAYLQGTVTTLLNNIYSTVLQTFNLTTEINATTHAINFTPTIIVNATINLTVNSTNTTNIYNNSYIIENNNTIIYNFTENVTVSPVFNVTTQNVTVQNVTVVVNTTTVTVENITVVVNQTNTTIVYNNSYLTENNNTLIYNFSYLTENNFTIVYNNTQNVTVVVNMTPTFNVTVNNSELLPYLTEINTTTQNTYSYMTTVMYPLMLTMNSTITSIQSVVNNIYSVVLSIQTTVGNIFNLTTEINQTVGAINFTPTIEVNVSVNTTTVQVQNVTVVVNTTNLTFDYATQALYVWNATTRNLTYYEPTFINVSAISDAVWAYPTRTITYFDYETQALYVWNSTSRNLTYYAPATVNETAISTAVWNATARTLTDYNQTEVLNYLANINATVAVINGTVAVINGQTYEINQTVWAINNSLVPNTVYIW